MASGRCYKEAGVRVAATTLLVWFSADASRSPLGKSFWAAPSSVINHELSLTPKPPRFLSNRTAAPTGRRMTSFVAQPSWSALPGCSNQRRVAEERKGRFRRIRCP